MVNIGAHFPRAARPPGPNARADIIGDRDIRAALTDPFRDWVREFRTVDNYENIGIEGERSFDGFVNASDERWETGDDSRRPHHCDIRKREDGGEASSLHMLAANSSER